MCVCIIIIIIIIIINVEGLLTKIAWSNTADADEGSENNEQVHDNSKLLQNHQWTKCLVQWCLNQDKICVESCQDLVDSLDEICREWTLYSSSRQMSLVMNRLCTRSVAKSPHNFQHLSYAPDLNCKLYNGFWHLQMS